MSHRLKDCGFLIQADDGEKKIPINVGRANE